MIDIGEDAQEYFMIHNFEKTESFEDKANITYKSQAIASWHNPPLFYFVSHFPVFTIKKLECLHTFYPMKMLGFLNLLAAMSLRRDSMKRQATTKQIQNPEFVFLTSPCIDTSCFKNVQK